MPSFHGKGYTPTEQGPLGIPYQFRELDRRMTIWLLWRQYGGPLPFWKVPKENTVKIVEDKSHE